MPNQILQWLADHCRSCLLDEKWLLVEHLRVGQPWKDRLTLAACPHINLHAKTFRQLAFELAGPTLAASQQYFLSPTALELLMQSVLVELHTQGQLKYFVIDGQIVAGLNRLLARTFQDWRLASLELADLQADKLEEATKAQDLQLIFQTVLLKLQSQKLVDYAGCLQIIVTGLTQHNLQLPPALLILQPEPFPLTRHEQAVLDALIAGGTKLSRFESVELPEPLKTTEHLSLQIGAGEVNEVRGVFERVLRPASVTAIRLDQVEVLVTDYPLYAPLVLECLMQWYEVDASPPAEGQATQGVSQVVGGFDAIGLQMPVTFAEGIACTYSRPGRLLRSWIRWIDSDFLQAQAVEFVREGLLVRPSSATTISYVKLADTLRGVAIGVGIERYLPQLQRELASAETDAAIYALRKEPDALPCDYGIPKLRAALELLTPIIRLTQSRMAPKETIANQSLATLQAARELLEHHARADNQLDRYARGKLLEDIDGMLAMVRSQGDMVLDVRSWLETLPSKSRILASTPKPGCVHVAPVEQGGAIGRPHLFLLGMDDRRFPKAQTLDPILLDVERRSISNHLLTSDHLAEYRSHSLLRVLQRVQGVPAVQLTCSYSNRNLVDDSPAFPSPMLQQLGLDASSAKVVSFVHRESSQHLRALDTELAEFVAELARAQTSTVAGLARVQAARLARLHQRYDHLRWQQIAQSQQETPQFTAYDGLVPAAGPDLLKSFATRPLSPSRMETLGACPRKYFFQRALEIVPPDRCEADPDRWLSPMQLGSCLHELFESFWMQHLATHQSLEVTRDMPTLLAMLHDHVTKWQAIVPMHHADAFERQLDELEEFCEIFLHKEFEYCRQRSAVPWLMEASLGGRRYQMTQPATCLDTETPIEVHLPNGRELKLGGRIDRIDRCGNPDAPQYVIWDYKTGSNFGYNQSDPFGQGRTLQPLLYVLMLRKRLSQLKLDGDQVAGFGYFFPSPKCEGQRIEWSTEQLLQGQALVGQLLDLLESGTFIATTNKNDCTYCEYAPVCGDTAQLVQLSQWKTDSDEQLKTWQQIRAAPAKPISKAKR